MDVCAGRDELDAINDGPTGETLQVKHHMDDG